MKVILTQDIENLGAAGDTVEVKSGYGRNYLMPRNLAIPATRGNTNAVAHLKTQNEIRARKSRREAEKVRDNLEKMNLRAELVTGEEDRVFGSVTTHTIADLIADQGVKVDRRKIELEEPIKALGLFTVKIKLDKDVTASVKLQVIKKES